MILQSSLSLQQKKSNTCETVSWFTFKKFSLSLTCFWQIFGFLFLYQSLVCYGYNMDETNQYVVAHPLLKPIWRIAI